MVFLENINCSRQGHREDLGGPGQNTKVGSVIGLGARPQEILDVFLEAPEAPFHGSIHYIHTCKLPSSTSDVRLKSTKYRAL